MLRTNHERLGRSLADLARIGATAGGGVTRLALSDEDRAGRDQLRVWLEEAGLAVRIDDLGNMIGRRAGAEDLPPVILASHIDSVRQGGKFDGAYGVLGALEVIRTLDDHGIATRHPLEIVNWTNEEGVRFEPAMIASGVVAGRFTRDYMMSRTDPDGRTQGEELERIGYLGDAANRPSRAAAYLELHIEQGPVLEDADIPVGIVEGIVGITWSEVTVIGHADHAGPSPMPLRKDALTAAAELITGVERYARETSGAVGTCGRIVAEPNIINTIPGKVVFSADFRHQDPATLERLVDRLRGLGEITASSRGVEITVDRFWTSEPTTFDPGVVEQVQQAADELGIPALRLWSGAGHDAKYAQDVYPSALIFCRSQRGLSHCEEEHSTLDDLGAGADVLLGATLRLANA
jgi:beta-ureidopropionase / N-carbamoyl-L-amino-acid hydrolase